MRLFLASHDFGNFEDEFKKLLGAKRKALLISNARDYHAENKYIDNVVHAKVKMFAKFGIEAAGLDLRRFFGKETKLRDFLDQQTDVGAFYSLGGNVFLLRTAMKLSGLDKILQEKLANDEILYGGSSAGSMVTTTDLSLYMRADLRPEDVQEYYSAPAEMRGLGLIQEFLIPHADDAKYYQNTVLYQERAAEAGKEVVLLNDSDVLVINDSQCEILRG